MSRKAASKPRTTRTRSADSSRRTTSKTGSKRAVVLVSGGLDSTTCLAIAQHEGYDIYALSFDYGQRHQLELKAAARQAKLWGAVRHVVLRVNMREIGGSALTDNIAVPKNDPTNQLRSVPAMTGRPATLLKQGATARDRFPFRDPNDRSANGQSSAIPVTYVPARNTIFLSLALGWAETLRADAIFIGVNAVDYSGYPDCRPQFIAAFDKLAKLATKGGVEGTWRVKIRTPLIEMSKADIVKRASELGVDFGATWSCYDPMRGGRPCGQCDSCVLRAKGFSDAGQTDPAI